MENFVKTTVGYFDRKKFALPIFVVAFFFLN